MFLLSAIVWFGLYLHAAMGGVVAHVDGQSLPLGDPPAGSFLSARFDVGDAPGTLTYGFEADGFAAMATGWSARPGDAWSESIGYDVDGAVVTGGDGGALREFAWMSAVVLPEPGAAAGPALAWGLLATRRRAVRQP